MNASSGQKCSIIVPDHMTTRDCPGYSNPKNCMIYLVIVQENSSGTESLLVMRPVSCETSNFLAGGLMAHREVESPVKVTLVKSSLISSCLNSGITYATKEDKSKPPTINYVVE